MTSTPASNTPDTIVLIHGLWMTPRSWEHWVAHYTARGYRVLAPAYPGLEVEVEALRADPSPIEALTVPGVVAHLEGIIRGLDRPPILMGHTFGGAFVQILLDHGLGAAGVAIDSVPAEGILVVPVSQIRASFPVLRNPANRHRAVPFTPEQFHYAFTNTLSAEDGEGGVVGIGRRDDEEERQARATTQQGVGAEAPQEGGRVMGGGVPAGGIGVAPPPGEDRRAVDDEIASAGEAAAEGRLDHDDEEHLVGWGTGRRRPLALLAGAGDLEVPGAVTREPAGQRQRRPRAQPVVHILVGEPPEGPQQGDQQQRFLAVGARLAAWTFRQRRRAPPVGQPHRHAAEGQQLERRHERQSCDMQCCRLLPQRTLVGWGRDRRCVRAQSRDHGYLLGAGTSRVEEVAYSTPLRLGNALWGGILANFTPGHQDTYVDFRNDDRAPLLFIAGGEDNIMPPSVNQSNAHHYRRSKAITAYKEFPGRSHYTVGQPGWEEVADYALAWALNPVAVPTAE